MKKFWNWHREKDSNGKVVKNVLRIYGPIDEEIWWGDEVTPDDFRSELEMIEGDVELWINSPGGNVFAAAQIYNMLMEHKGSIHVHIDAIAASAASVIAMAGTVITMSPVSMMMIHNPATIALGDHNEMEKAIDVLNEVKESIINAYQIKTGLDRKTISKLMENETWMNAKKALELGFADEIAYTDEDDDEDDDDDFDVANSFSAKSYIAKITNKLTAAYRVEPVVNANPEPEADPEQEVETAPEPEAAPVDEPVTVESKQYYDRLKNIKDKF